MQPQMNAARNFRKAAECGEEAARRKSRFDREISTLTRGWGGKGSNLRMAESKSADYSMFSGRIWKTWPKPSPAISIGWQPFPNEKQPSGRIRHGQNPRLDRSCQPMSPDL